MKSSLRLLGTILPLLVSIVIILVMYRKVALDDLLTGLGSGSPPWVFAYVLLSAIEPVLRGVRWALLSGARPFSLSIKGLYISKAGNNLLPMRMGDAVRSQFVRDRAGVPYSRSAASILAESALDLSMLGVLVLVYAAAVVSGRGLIYGLGLLVALPLAVITLLSAEKRLKNRPAPSKGLVSLFHKLTGHFGTMLRDGKAPFVLAATVLIWIHALAASWCGLRAFLPSVTPLGVVSTIVFVYLSVLVPSAPGFVGTYHAAVAGSLALMGFSLASYAAAPVAIHLLQFIPQTIIGLLLGLRYLISNDWRKAFGDFNAVRKRLLKGLE
ncbi:MAG: flippase-like domain-containing protein [Veillonellaceae bacterium]|nr:flippase-like domain-containing protein [Veillonellaceae bacterium]